MDKKYSVNTQDGKIVSVEVDGVQYEDPDEISDPEDRAKIEMLMSQTMDETGFGDNFDREFEKEFQELESTSAKFPTLIVGTFASIAVIMLAIAVISGVSAARGLAREVSVPGRVVDVVLRRYQATDTRDYEEYYYPVVEFYLPDASLRTVQLSEGSWPAAYAKGDKVTILYDPQQPNQARIQSASSNFLVWILPGITGLVGAAFLAAALVAGWFFKPEPAPDALATPAA